MAGIAGLTSALDSALGGIRVAFARADRAADKVAKSGIANRDGVTVSAEARDAASADRVREPDLVEGILDLRVAKYAAVANMRVASTVSDMASEAVDMVKPRDR